MKDIKTLSKRIGECRAEIERLKDQTARGEAAIVAAAQQEEAIAEIRRRLADESAQAFVENRATKIAPIDAELATAVKAATQLQVAAEAARSGLEMIEERCGEIVGEIVDLIAQRRRLIVTELEARREVAIDQYIGAVDALAPIFSNMIAADRLIRKVTEPATVRKLPGEALFERLRLERLPIPWSRSGKEQPLRSSARGWSPGAFEAAEPYMKFEPVLAAPTWLHDEKLSDTSMESLAAELRAVGVDGV